jgi:hypothetical protein
MESMGMVSPERHIIGELGAGLVDPFSTVATGAKLAHGMTALMPLMTAYHGTPHKFEAFDASKIGTGEGVQAYGHGIYVAENPEVAKTYKSAIDPAARSAFMHLQSNNGDINKTIKDVTKDLLNYEKNQDFLMPNVLEQTKQKLNILKAEKAGKPIDIGNLYKIDLPDEHIAKMLDWDKPLSEQHPDVQKAIKKTKELLPLNAMDDLGGDLSLLYGKDITPKDFLNTWESLTGSVGSGEAALAKHGIPGIKYLDEQSRGAGEGTRNFVIFPGNEDKLKILSRNGVPVNP